MRARMFAVVGLATFSGPRPRRSEFKQYASTDGRFKVLFPGPVKTETVEVPSGKEKLKITIDSVELRGGTAFMVTYVDAPPEVAKHPRWPAHRQGSRRQQGRAGEGAGGQDRSSSGWKSTRPATC